MSSEFQSDRIKSDFLNLTFVADDYEINFDKLSEGEEDDQYTGKFRVRSRSVPARPARRSKEGMASRRSSSIGEGRKPQGNDRSSNIPQRQGLSMVFSEDEMRDSLTGRRHSSISRHGTAGAGSNSSVRASDASDASFPENEPTQRLSRITEETISSSGTSQTEASEEWCTKSLTSRALHRGKKDPGDAIDPKKMDVIVTAQDTVGFDTVPLVELRSATVADGDLRDIRSHGSMEWIPGHTLHFDVSKGVNNNVEIHLELLPFANPPQGIIDGKMLLDAAEKYEQVQLASGALGLHVRMKPSKQRGNKKGLKWHPEVRDGKSFSGSNRRNTPFQPLVPIAESEGRLSEGRISDGRISRSILEDPRMSEARMSDGRMSAAEPRMSEARMSDGRMSAAEPRMSEARMSDGRMSARMSTANPRMSEARMSDGSMSAADPRMSEARMSNGRMSQADPRMSEARMSDGRMSAADPRMSEARMSDGSMSHSMSEDSPMSEARMSDGRVSARMSAANPRMSEARMSDGSMAAADPGMSEARMSDGRMSARMSAANPRMSEARMSDGSMSATDPRMSEARMSDGRMSARMSQADPRMSEARMSEGRMLAANPRMSEARKSDGRMSARMSEDWTVSDRRMSNGRMSNVRMSEARPSDLSEPDLRSCPSLVSMQLDASDLEHLEPRASCAFSTGRRSTVRMQQDPSEASDAPSSSDAAGQSVGASLNHVGKLSLEAQSGSLFGADPCDPRDPRSSVSMQVASSESDSGSHGSVGSVASPGMTSVTPMATIAEDRGSTEVSSKSPRTSMKSRASRASRLGRRTSDPMPPSRAMCRFTHPKSVDFCGLELLPVPCVPCHGSSAEALAGRDRSALLVLLEQAAKSVEAARQMKGDVSAMPRILAQLSAELTLHGRELRVGRLQTVGTEPVALAVLSQLIEVLDTLVPKANDRHENSLVLGHDGSMGGEAKPVYTESLLESLRQSFGAHGFLPEVVECLHSQLPALPAATSEQLKIQCLLSLRLATAWETPSSVQKPMELVIQQKGCEVLIQQLEALICRLKQGDGSTTVIAQLALTLETQQLLLCSELGLEQLCDTFTKARSGATRRETPLATIALETLEILAQQNLQASSLAISTVLPAAVNILALLLNATPVALTASTDQLVRSLCELISPETMTPRFISAMLQLVRSPSKPRIWLGSVSNAVQIRKKLRQGLIRSKVPSMVAIAAKEKLAALLQQYGDAVLRLDAGPVSKAVEKRASQVIAAGSYYDTVEAFVSEVYGNLGPVEEEMADFRSTVDDLDDEISKSADRRKSSTLVSALSTMRQAIFENCLMPQTRRRSSRGL